MNNYTKKEIIAIVEDFLDNDNVHAVEVIKQLLNNHDFERERRIDNLTKALEEIRDGTETTWISVLARVVLDAG